MTQYRKKPVVVEAAPVSILMEQAKYDWRALPEWLRAAHDMGSVIFEADSIRIRTREGWLTAITDDLIIRGVAGELYPIRKDIFEQTYEPV